MMVVFNKKGSMMPTNRSGRRSLSLDKSLVEYVEKYLANHKIERLRNGKDASIVSVVREALFLWFEEKGLTDDVLKFLAQKQQRG